MCVLHFGRTNNIKAVNEMNDYIKKIKIQEKDLIVLISSNFKFIDHINIIVNKATSNQE